jgi:hypothetical protein
MPSFQYNQTALCSNMTSMVIECLSNCNITFVSCMNGAGADFKLQDKCGLNQNDCDNNCDAQLIGCPPNYYVARKFNQSISAAVIPLIIVDIIITVFMVGHYFFAEGAEKNTRYTALTGGLGVVAGLFSSVAIYNCLVPPLNPPNQYYPTDIASAQAIAGVIGMPLTLACARATITAKSAITYAYERCKRQPQSFATVNPDPKGIRLGMVLV